MDINSIPKTNTSMLWQEKKANILKTNKIT